MAAQRWNTQLERWEWLQRYQHDGSAWAEVAYGSEDQAVAMSSLYVDGRYLGEGTILQRDVSAMPLHPDSAAMAQFMWDWSPWTPGGGWAGKTGFNSSAQGTQPVHAYVVDSSHPDCSFREFAGSTTITAGTPYEIDTYMRGQIPMPSWAVSAQNQDRGMAIYDRSTGIMREYFMVTPTADPEVWQGGGGYSIVRPGLMHLAEDNYALQQHKGLSNVAGMHNSFGFIAVQEAMQKQINHALTFTIGAAWGLDISAAQLRSEIAAGRTNYNGIPIRVSWPARASDGKAEQYIPESPITLSGGRTKTYTSATPDLTPTHGQWGRLDPNVDPMYDPRTGLPYRPFTRVLIEAAKTYGLVPTDTNLFVNAFNGEQGRTYKHFFGVDPWASGGIIASLYQKGYEGPSIGSDISDFPWDRTQWAPLDWGRPSPDMNLAPGKTYPWWSPDDPNRPTD